MHYDKDSKKKFKYSQKILDDFGPIFNSDQKEQSPLRKYSAKIYSIIETIKNSDFSIGYNASKGELCDMYETGIIDPAKVTRSGLQNASSIAGMILTTECIVVDNVEEA